MTFFMNQTSKAASYSWNSTGWRKLPLKQPEKTTRRWPRKRTKKFIQRIFFLLSSFRNKNEIYLWIMGLEGIFYGSLTLFLSMVQLLLCLWDTILYNFFIWLDTFRCWHQKAQSSRKQGFLVNKRKIKAGASGWIRLLPLLRYF